MKYQKRNQSGVALMTAMVVLIVVSGIVMGLSMDVSKDINITRNLRIYEDSANWASGAMEMTEDVITMAVDTRGEDEDVTNGYSKTLEGVSYKLEQNGTFYKIPSNGVVQASLIRGGKNVAEVDVTYGGVGLNPGSSLLIAFGYEGLGRSMANSAGVLYYAMKSSGSGMQGDGKQKARVTYEYKTMGR